MISSSDSRTEAGQCGSLHFTLEKFVCPVKLRGKNSFGSQGRGVVAATDAKEGAGENFWPQNLCAPNLLDPETSRPCLLGLQSRLDQGQQIGVFIHGFELGELRFHIFGRVEQEAGIGFEEHGRVVEGIARRYDVVVQ